MPTATERRAHADWLIARTAALVAQGLERKQIMERLGISKGHAQRLMRVARVAQSAAQSQDKTLT